MMFVVVWLQIPKLLSKSPKSHLPVLPVSQVKRGVGAASATQPKGNRLPSGVVSAVRLAVARVAKK